MKQLITYKNNYNACFGMLLRLLPTHVANVHGALHSPPVVVKQSRLQHLINGIPQGSISLGPSLM